MDNNQEKNEFYFEENEQFFSSISSNKEELECNNAEEYNENNELPFWVSSR